MNKKRIDGYIPIAYTALRDVGIAKNEKFKKDDGTEIEALAIKSTFRGYISSFGAAITMGSLLSAVAFFTKTSENTAADRTLLMKAIYNVIEGKAPESENSLLLLVMDSEDKASLKEKILDAAIALKLAMNMYVLV